MSVECIAVESLLARVRHLRETGYRLVQIGATRLTQQLELTYSFDLDGGLVNLRLILPPSDACVPSISSVYWCAFIYENEIHDLFGIRVDRMAIDFQGQFYQTAVKHPFGPPQTPAAHISAPTSVLTIAAARS
jgi:ech hydrogenase subunit D